MARIKKQKNINMKDWCAGKLSKKDGMSGMKKNILLLVIAIVVLSGAGVSAGERLRELGRRGELSDELVAEFYRYSFERAKEEIVASDEFWDWVAGNDVIRQGLLVGLYPDYNAEVVRYLSELRKEFGGEVERYAHLALAFGFVYGAAKDGCVRSEGLDSWVGKGRAVPSCVESFRYYIENRGRMTYSISTFSWPLLLYVADIDVPLAERDWALGRYGKLRIDKLSKLHGEIKYVAGASAKKRGAMAGTPMALPRLMRDGGVCSQQSYYASSVMKCLGVPAVRFTVPDHAYEGWVDKGRNGIKVEVGTNLGRRNADYFCPKKREMLKEYRFGMLADAVNRSYDGYLRGIIACHVFGMLSEEDKVQGAGLLTSAIEGNRYVDGVWQEAMKAIESGVMDLGLGWELLGNAKRMSDRYPELSCEMFGSLVRGMKGSEQGITDERFSEVRDRFYKIIDLLVRLDRKDLAKSVFMPYADYMAEVKGADSVVKLLLVLFMQGMFSLDDEKELFDYVCKIANDSKDDDALEKLLRNEYSRRRQEVLKSGEKLYERYYSNFVQVAKAYITYCKDAGDLGKASEIYLELDKLNKENEVVDDLHKVIKDGRVLGAVGDEVEDLNPKQVGCFVWRILYDIPKGKMVRVRVKHAASGDKGEFYLTAWTDEDDNGVPDSEIGVSELMTKDKGQWSEWEFEVTDKTVFVGVATKKRTTVYYQMNGKLEGYSGLSDRLFYSRKFGEVPEKTAQPRYINMRVEIR